MPHLLLALALVATPPPEKQDDGCAGVPASAFTCAGLDALGCGATCVGASLLSVDAGRGDNCAEDCALALISIGFAAVGAVIGAVGFILLGPVSAIVVTSIIAATAAGRGRAVGPAILGGTPGILVGLAGVGLGALALVNMDLATRDVWDPTAPGGLEFYSGLTLVLASGAISLVGAWAADRYLGGPVDEEGDEVAPASPPQTVRLRVVDEAAMAF